MGLEKGPRLRRLLGALRARRVIPGTGSVWLLDNPCKLAWSCMMEESKRVLVCSCAQASEADPPASSFSSLYQNMFMASNFAGEINPGREN